MKVSVEAIKLDNVKQLKLGCKDDMAKRQFLQAFFEQSTSQAMIFVNTKNTADFLIELFKRLSEKLHRHLDCKILTSSVQDHERDKTMDQFRAGKTSALICTNVAARGIDVPEVDIVINYDIPVINNHGYYDPDFANYLHRVGRTGRFQTDGLAITFYQTEGNIGENEASYISKIEKYYDMKMQDIVSIEEFMHLFYEMRPQLRKAAAGAIGQDLE